MLAFNHFSSLVPTLGLGGGTHSKIYKVPEEAKLVSANVPILWPQNVPSFCSDSPTCRNQRGVIFTYLVPFLIFLSALPSIELPAIKVSGYGGRKEGDRIVLLRQS